MSVIGDAMGEHDKNISDNVQVATMATVHQVQSRVGELRTELTSVKDQVKAVDAKVTTQGGQLSTMQRSLDELTGNFEKMRGWLEGTTSDSGERKEGALSRAALSAKRLGEQNWILGGILVAVLAEVITRYLFPISTTIKCASGHC